jgi:beta-phosphoglucomutase-like phosphatase (HAD superfamily)
MIIIVDIDATLAASGWRDNIRPDWDAYHAASKDDQPNEVMVELINTLAKHHFIVAVTTRPAKWRRLTMHWLLKNGCGCINKLLMRPDDDFRPSPVVKVELIAPFMAECRHIVALDDRDDVVAAYVAAGFTALQVRTPQARAPVAHPEQFQAGTPEDGGHHEVEAT